MKEKRQPLQSALFPALLLIPAVLGTVLYYASRATWVFTDLSVNMLGLSFILLYVMIANCVAVGALCAVRVWTIKCKNGLLYTKKPYRAALIVLCVSTAAFFITGAIFGISMLESESSHSYLIYLKASLYDAVFMTLVPALAIFLCCLSAKKRKVVAAVALAVTAVIAVTKLVPLTPYKITSHPTVFNTGEEYSVVFSTNGCGTGYIEYTYGGKDYRVYDQSGGRLNTNSRIHSVSVPFEHLDNNSYKVGSLRVFEQYSYGSHTGAEVVSDEYEFVPASTDGMTCLVVSDWHTYLQRAYSAVSYVGDYDAVILMGDSTPGVDGEQQVVRNIVQFAGELSKGTKPVLYTRGNHETRGEYANSLADALGLDKFYYVADMGGVSFVVLDSGEDKDDSHPEYGGMNDYNTYRTSMIEWLKTAEIHSEKVIALSHSWKISDVEKELSLAGWAEIDRLGAKLMISGHTHQCRLIGENSDTEKEIMSLHPDITGYMDGGKSGGGYVASKLTVSDADILIEAYSMSGEKVFEHTVVW